MKKNFFPMALMAIAMGLNACSSDDPVVNAGGGNVPFADGGYVKMAINMPSAPSSRAYSENFGDGLENEYEVKNATLILFEGTSEDAAKFHSAYDLPVSMTKDGNTQITSTTKIVKKVDNSVPGNLYGYVLLNHNDMLTYTSETDGTRIATTLSINGTALNDATSTDNNMTFKTFREQVITGGAKKFNAKGFLMDNAPLSSEKGGADFTAAPAGTAKTQTLVNLTNKVYKSQAEAEAKPATDVYVERALAKVTMTKAEALNNPENNKLEGSGVSSVTGSTAQTSTTVKYTIEGWTLDVTNNKSYLGRSYDVAWNNLFSSDATVATAEKYRFVGHSAVGTSALYRTYWGTDPNYDSYDDTKAKDNFTYLNAKPATGSNITNSTTYKGLGENNPLYCMENTFNVANMQDRQITRAIVKVKFFNGQPFYTFNDDKSTLYDGDNMKKHIKQIILSKPAVLTQLKSDFSGTTIGEGNIDLNFGTRDKYGNILLESYTVHKTAGVTEATTDKTYSPSAGSTLNKDLQLGNIVEYENGIAYYPIRIKHFGDDQTPWNKTTADMTNPYGTTKQAENFLGRYGVLRNNWYNIEISSIKNVGSAVVPEIKLDDPTPGDKPENYISVRINVLSWAKRNQEEHL